MTLHELHAEYMYSTTNPTSATGNFDVQYLTALFGEFERQIQADWILENGEWKLVWDRRPKTQLIVEKI